MMDRNKVRTIANQCTWYRCRK